MRKWNGKKSQALLTYARKTIQRKSLQQSVSKCTFTYNLPANDGDLKGTLWPRTLICHGRVDTQASLIPKSLGLQLCNSSTFLLFTPDLEMFSQGDMVECCPSISKKPGKSATFACANADSGKSDHGRT
ncbi:hypothetical protein [Undibacterium crateris]|uniref:hypothetical protein n=1 Tax=Undibacterium crateris TaxID=2528175 RepID=UPI001389E8A3|nr:hypothetical protein [Undibacterium crateris]NDI85745.1 hypothetical protein [Undibacterium crateris]